MFYLARHIYVACLTVWIIVGGWVNHSLVTGGKGCNKNLLQNVKTFGIPQNKNAYNQLTPTSNTGALWTAACSYSPF